MSVKSTYNFVPAPSEAEVFRPDWADQVSQDIPFQDGESGEITWTLTAETPIFIRNGHAEGKEDHHFCHSEINGKKHYFIPASSLKGMVRNVLEIMSFSRLQPINKHRYSFRNLTRNSLYMRSYKSSEVQCGWLYENEVGDWFIDDWGKPARIAHPDLDPILGTNFRESFLNRQPEQKTALYKYKKVAHSLKHRFTTVEKKNYTIAVKNNSGRQGTIVLTGQSGKRQEPQGNRASGKLYEFVFLKPDVKAEPIWIKPEQQEDFKFIYHDQDKDNISPDWKFWSAKLAQKEHIPIFFTKAVDGAVKHFGLAFMYKLPYRQSTHQTLPYGTYQFAQKDLADTIFGTVKEQTDTLKGRVFFGAADTDQTEMEELATEILAGPKASYYPFYLQQENPDSKYFTYEDQEASLRGFKRYPVHLAAKSGRYTPDQLQNSKVFTTFQALKAGTVFSGKIRFHNLKKVEIGALFSAITFHGNEDTFYHSLGAAKPLGYGKIKIQIDQVRFLEQAPDAYMAAYEALMEEHHPAWLSSAPMTELLAMAADPSEETNRRLRYPQLKLPNVPAHLANEFKNYERDKVALAPYSSHGHPPKIRSIYQRLLSEEKVATGDFVLDASSFKAIKTQMKATGFETLPEALQNILIDGIKKAFANDRPSRRKLSRRDFDGEYEWHTTITNWLGSDKAQALYEELNPPLPKP